MKRTKNKIIAELGDALHEMYYLEYNKIPKLKEELKKYKLSKSEKDEFEIWD